MLRGLCILAILSLLAPQSAQCREPDASEQLRELFEASDSLGNRSFVVETITFQKRGDMERESSSTSTVYLVPERGITLINRDDLWHRLEKDRELAWTSIGSKVGVQRTRSLKDDADRSGNLAMSNQNVFWFIPTVKNADYLLANFRLSPTASEDRTVFSLKLADTPEHGYWKNMKKSGLELTGTLEFDEKTGLPLEGKVTMLRDDYLREYRVKVKSRSMEVPDNVLVVPAAVEEKARQKITAKQ